MGDGDQLMLSNLTNAGSFASTPFPGLWANRGFLPVKVGLNGIGPIKKTLRLKNWNFILFPEHAIRPAVPLQSEGVP